MNTPARRFCPMCEIQVVSAENQCPNCLGPLMAGDPDDLVGKVIDGRYTVIQRLGKGGMGVVYRAKQRFLDRDVALKVLRPEMAMDTMAVRRFLQEAKAASGLKNPHTVTIFEFGSTSEGTLYFTMELLSGRSLREVIEQDGPMSPERVIELGAQVCESLAEAHEQGIWHRDLKPDNIYLIDTPQGHDYVKVLDFGIAKVASQQTQLTSTGAICGTPQYMSPEQAKGIPLDGRSDVYSLGIVLYEALCGCAPFEAITPIQMLMAHITQPPPLPRNRRPGLQVPAGIEEVVMWSLGKEPEERPGSAKEFGAALRASQQGSVAPSVSRASTVNMHSGVQSGVGIRPAPAPRPASPVILDTLTPMPAAETQAQVQAAFATPRTATPLPRSIQQEALEATAFRTHASAEQDDSPPPNYGRPWWKLGAVGVVLMFLATAALVWRPWENPQEGKPNAADKAESATAESAESPNQADMPGPEAAAATPESSVVSPPAGKEVEPSKLVPVEASVKPSTDGNPAAGTPADGAKPADPIAVKSPGNVPGLNSASVNPKPSEVVVPVTPLPKDGGNVVVLPKVAEPPAGSQITAKETPVKVEKSAGNFSKDKGNGSKNGDPREPRETKEPRGTRTSRKRFRPKGTIRTSFPSEGPPTTARAETTILFRFRVRRNRRVHASHATYGGGLGSPVGSARSGGGARVVAGRVRPSHATGSGRQTGRSNRGLA